MIKNLKKIIIILTMKTKIFLILLSLILFTPKAISNEIATQNISTSLGEVLEISKIIVDTVEFEKNENLDNIKKKNSNKQNKNFTTITLSPIKLKIHTNLTTPISVSADFQELTHNEILYNFNQKDIIFIPKSRTINNPYDNIITDEFIPQLTVQPNAKSGNYTGKIMFTLGVI